MAEKKVIITLDAAQVQELEEIILDRDAAAALEFLREVVYKPAKAHPSGYCAPPNPGVGT